MSFELKINKPMKDSKIYFESENNDIIKQKDEKTYSSVIVNDGSEISYIVKTNGYKEIKNKLIVNKDVTLSPELQKYVKLKINADKDTKISFDYDGKHYEQNEIEVLSNSIVTYNVSKRDKETITKTIVVNDDITLTPELLDKIKDDESITKYEKERVDRYAGPKIINQKQYKKLPPEERVHYVLYDARLSNRLGFDFLTKLDDVVSELYWMIPYAQMISPYTNGSLSSFQNNFLMYLQQLENVARSAKSLNGKLRGIRRPLNKVGLGSLIDILTICFSTIGSLGGIIYGMLNNPQMLIQSYAEPLKDVNLDEIRDNLNTNVFPNLDYVRGMIERTYMPNSDVKESLLQNVDEIYNAANMSRGGLDQLYALKNLALTSNQIEEGMMDVLEIISMMGYGWAMGGLPNMIHKMRVDHGDIKRNMSNSLFANAQYTLRRFLDKILYKTKKYYIRVADLKDLGMNNNKNSYRINADDNNGNGNSDYTDGFNDGFNYGSNGESEEQKNARIDEYMKKILELGKDPSGYVDGYNQGWKSGNNNYNNELNNLFNEDDIESYKNGYDDGYYFGNNIRDYAITSLNIGQLMAFIDIDNHIHLMPLDYLRKRLGNNYNTPLALLNIDDLDDSENPNENPNVPESIYTPLGRIDENDIVWILNEHMEEIQYGVYDRVNHIIKDNDENTILYVNEKFLYITDFKPEVNDENIDDEIKVIYDVTVMELERKAPEPNKNPYYVNGWKKGYEDRKEYNNEINSYVNADRNGNEEGYNWGANKTTDDIMHIINESDDVYFNQGVARGYNTYQSEYNITYNRGWFMASNDEDDEEDIKEQFLQQIITEYHLENLTPQELAVNSYYMGANNGWDDSLNESITEPKYKDYYLDY